MADTGEETEANIRDTNNSPDMSSDGLKNVNSEDGLVTKAVGGDLDIEEFILKGAVPKNLTDMGMNYDVTLEINKKRKQLLNISWVKY